jgi:hypothetical protein
MAITNYVLDIKNRWSAKSKQICAEPAEISEISVGSVFCYILNADCAIITHGFFMLTLIKEIKKLDSKQTIRLLYIRTENA